MEYRKLGRSGLKVSPLCLGAMMFGGPASEADSQRMIAAARDAGINFIDTADVYNGGKSEEVVGRAIRNERDRWVVATKLDDTDGRGAATSAARRASGSSQAARRSLARLGTDYIDIYYLHREDLETPLEETVRALADLVRAGMIRYFALSNSQGVAHRRDLQHLRPHRHRPPGRDPAALQRAQSHGRGRAVAGCRLLRPGRRSLQPAGARRAVGQVRAGRHAPCRQPRGAQRSAHDADRVAAGIAGDRAEAEGPRRGARHDRQPVRHGLGAGEPPGHLGDRRAAHRSPTRRTMSARLATSCPPTARPWSTAWWFPDIRRRPATATRWSRKRAG